MEYEPKLIERQNENVFEADALLMGGVDQNGRVVKTRMHINCALAVRFDVFPRLQCIR